MSSFPKDTMKFSRRSEHLLVSILLGILLSLLFGHNLAEDFLVITACVFGGLFPDFDHELGFGHRNPIFHSFLIPTIVGIALPKTAVVRAFTLGYGAHLITDLDNPKQKWKYVKQTTGNALLWLSMIVILMAFFDVSFYEILRNL